MNTILEKLTFADIVTYLGEPVKTTGGHSYWQCPICLDNSKNNLIYTQSKELLTCFANNQHSHEIYKNIRNNVKEVSFKPEVVKPIKEKPKVSIDMEYIYKCEYELMNDVKSQDFIFKKRGLTYDTCSFMGIGIDRNKKCWVFPIFNMDFELIGAEYRPGDLSKKGLHKASGTYAELCPVNRIEDADSLVITEGFIDAYTLWQHFEESGESSKWQIMTPSNGVGTIKNLLSSIPTSKYKKVVFWIDNDEAGEQARQDIKKLANFDFYFKMVDCSCCKDINEWYLKHIKGEK